MLRAEKTIIKLISGKHQEQKTHFKISISNKIATVALILWTIYHSIYLDHMDIKNADLLLEIREISIYISMGT